MPAPSLQLVSGELPEPPYPADTKSNGWKPQFDIQRIESSETWVLAEDDERPWLLRIWLEAWKSVPVGTLPSDLRLLSRRIGCKKTFLEAHSEVFLRGWVLHNDGLMYQSHITEQVLEMLGKRQSARDRQKRKREANVTRDKADVTRDSRVSHRQERKGKEKDLVKNPSDSCRKNEFCDVQPKPQAKPRKSIPYDDIRALFVEILPTLRRPQSTEHWTAQRKQMVRNRFNDQLPDLDAWREYFEYVSTSQFLTGQAASTNGRTWTADFDWLLKPGNLLKISEGKYHG